jgi:hypothetical protein
MFLNQQHINVLKLSRLEGPNQGLSSRDVGGPNAKIFPDSPWPFPWEASGVLKFSINAHSIFSATARPVSLPTVYMALETNAKGPEN